MSLLGVTIGPGKVGGTQWDGMGTVDQEDVASIAAALGAAEPYAAVLAILARPTIQALEKPDAAGRAMLVTATATGSETKLTADRDTFTPQWSGPPSWSRVPLDGTTRLRVEIIDRDAMFDDPVGTFEINSSDMLRAIQAGRVLQVRVADQTNRQVLFAAISVMPE